MNSRKQSIRTHVKNACHNAFDGSVSQCHLATAAEYKRAVLAGSMPSPLLPSSWGQAATAIFDALTRVPVYAVRVLRSVEVDDSTFSTCISIWGRTQLEIAEELLHGLVDAVPCSRWKELIGRETVAVSRAIRELSTAEAARGKPGGSRWHVSQLRPHVESATSRHVALMAHMMIRVVWPPHERRPPRNAVDSDGFSSPSHGREVVALKFASETRPIIRQAAQ